jgi:alpha-D-xyloside xylohydrolase
MNSDGCRDLYLPEGEWVDFFTGRRYHGGHWLTDIYYPLELMPVFVRPGTRIPIYPDDVDSTDEMDLSKTVYLDITPDFKGYKI